VEKENGTSWMMEACPSKCVGKWANPLVGRTAVMGGVVDWTRVLPYWKTTILEWIGKEKYIGGEER